MVLFLREGARLYELHSHFFKVLQWDPFSNEYVIKDMCDLPRAHLVYRDIILAMTTMKPEPNNSNQLCESVEKMCL